MLRVEGKYIVDEQGKEVILVGYNVGNWMMLENFMLGYAGTEEEFRKAIKKYAGEEKYEYFFDRYYEYFLGEKDIRFMKEMGLNCIRVPFNYRHFESDNEPGVYNPKGLKLMDRLTEICKKYDMYIIWDLHAAQGYQSTSWHCDNNGQPTRIYTHADERKRFYQLWKYLARHFKGERIVAGYELVNEPDALPEYTDMLNEIYREAVEEIRREDPDHIIFLGGNKFNRRFETLEAPFAENLAYDVHYYLGACTSTPMHYPGEMGNITYDRSFVENQMDAMDIFMRTHNVPCWVGEFGVRTNYPGYTEDRLRCFADQLDVITKRHHHYSIWSYKDIGYLSTVTVKKDSPWTKFVSDIVRIKEQYFLDQNFRINEDWGMTTLLKLKDPDTFNDRYGETKEALVSSMKHALSTQLAQKMGQKFAELTKEELDELAASFAFDNCFIDERRKKIIETYGIPK